MRLQYIDNQLFMKNLVFVVPAISLLFSCAKKQDSTAEETTMRFTPILYLNNINIDECTDTTVILPITLRYVSGRKEEVTICMKDLPSWMTADTLRGTPDYFGYITLTINPQSAGTFPVDLSIKGSSTEQLYSFNIEIKEQELCSYIFTEPFKDSGFCTDRKRHFSNPKPKIRFTRIPNTDSFTFNETSPPLYAILNCDKRSFTISRQANNNYFNNYYEGDGYITCNTVIVDLEDKSDTEPGTYDRCLITYFRE